MDSINDGPGSVLSRAVNEADPGWCALDRGPRGFFVTAAWRTPAFVMLVLSLTALLVSDDLFGLQRNSYVSGDYTDLGWLLSYILWAAAALHPSMRETERRARASTDGELRPPKGVAEQPAEVGVVAASVRVALRPNRSSETSSG